MAKVMFSVKYGLKLLGRTHIENTRNAAVYHKNIIKPRAHTEVRRSFFSDRVVDPWNALDTDIKESHSSHFSKGDKTYSRVIPPTERQAP